MVSQPPREDRQDAELILEHMRSAGKPVFTVDYLTDRDKTNLVYKMSRSQGYIPYVTIRELNRIIIP